ncbi:hypothetical protein AB0N29_01735 [Nocardioides sp. NPDC092400]|uniref:hypothetical protein n=1 Tax=Nocardioides sp. NPDC092400 TaxID=3155196 RepID=UPI003421A2FB
MPVEMRMWRIDQGDPKPLTSALLPDEKTLEDFLEKDPSMLGDRLLVIGRQVRTPYNKYIDLLAVDADGNLHVLELKKDKTPRDVIAQVLDYGSWLKTLTRDEVIEQAEQHLSQPFEAAFEAVFGQAPPDEINGDLNLTVVATNLDNSSERIVDYLREFGVPINAVFFSYLEDDGRRYLARSWHASQEESTTKAPGKKSKRADWNGRDWYVNFGDDDERSWEDGRRLGFISAGGGAWYSQTLRGLPTGARVNVYIPGQGYVAVGETFAPAARFDQAQILIDGAWAPLAEQQLNAPYRHAPDGELETDELAEWVVPVRWVEARPADEAFREPGMFASQHSACKLRQEYTLKRLAEHFDLSEQDD